MDFPNTFLSDNGNEVDAYDNTGGGNSEDKYDPDYLPARASVLSVHTALTLQSPCPSRSTSSSHPSTGKSWLSTLVNDPDMVNEQARRSKPFELAAAAENAGDENGDNTDAGTHRHDLADAVPVA
jgi:hypothetical protein